jgi:hypothetical protein
MVINSILQTEILFILLIQHYLDRIIRIGEEMKPIVREFERKEYESWLAIKDKIKK